MNPVVVIGAGLAGLSAACYLKMHGCDVTVVEQEQQPGGRAGLLYRDGFTFETGPTVLTMPGLIADAIRAVTGDRSRNLGELLPMRRLDPAYRACFADGSTINVRYGREAMRDEIANTCGSVDAAAFEEFVDWLRRLYVLEMPKFIDRNYDSPLSLLSSPRALAQLLRLGAFGRLGATVRKRFADPRLHRLFSFQSMYAGLSPDSALALYAVITYMDTIEGVWSPEGGMYAVPTVMAQVAEKAGAVFRYRDPAETILRSPTGRVAGVRTSSGARIMADAVVCTLDLPTAYQRLLGDLRPPRAVRRGRYSPSAVVWHVGVRGVPDRPIAHHNIHFGYEWSSAFDALLKRGRLMPDPSRLVTIPSLDDPTMAPTGCSTLYILEPVPNLNGKINWSIEAGPLRERLQAFLAQQGYPTAVITQNLMTPLDWKAQGMAAGTPFALAHTFSQTGPFRPSNVERRLPGMFFAGSGTVPGVGVPMVLISGKLAASRVAAYLREPGR
jgi:phytoene desaturase